MFGLLHCRKSTYSTVQFHILEHSGVAPQISLVETISPNINRKALQKEAESWRNDPRKHVQQVDWMLHLNDSTRRRLEAKAPLRMKQQSWVSASSALIRPNSFSLVIDETLPKTPSTVGVATRIGSLQAGGHNLTKKKNRLGCLQDGQRATQRPSSAPPMATGCFVRSDEQAMALVLHDMGTQQPPTQQALYNFPRRQTLSVPQTPASDSRCIREGLTSRQLQARQNRQRESNGKDVVGHKESKGRDVVGKTMKHTVSIINVSPFANASVSHSAHEPSTSLQQTIQKPDIYGNAHEMAHISSCFNERDSAARAQTHGRVRPVANVLLMCC